MPGLHSLLSLRQMDRATANRLTTTHVQQRHAGVMVGHLVLGIGPGVNMDVLVALSISRQRRAHKHVVEGLGVHVKETIAGVPG